MPWYSSSILQPNFFKQRGSMMTLASVPGILLSWVPDEHALLLKSAELVAQSMQLVRKTAIAQIYQHSQAIQLIARRGILALHGLAAHSSGVAETALLGTMQEVTVTKPRTCQKPQSEMRSPRKASSEG